MFSIQTVVWSLCARARGLQCGAQVSAVLAVALAGCAAPAPKDYGGSWAPVNRFQSAPTEIPLSPAYTFYASPMDGTLRTMLQRWAFDNGLQLSYQVGSDFTLHQPVARIRSNDIQAAVGELNALYAPQGIVIAAHSKQIVVQPAPIPEPTAEVPR